jgi:hypothetical protein
VDLVDAAREHIEALIVVIVVLSLVPAGIAWVKQRQQK